MKKLERIVVIGLLLGILTTNSQSISPLGNPPGWNGGDYMSVSVLDEEV